MLVAPITGLRLGGFVGDVLLMMTASFPAIDPILIIYFVRA